MEFLSHNLFAQLAVVMVTASGLALLAFRIKQPLIIAYILAGLVLGPSVVDLTHDAEVMKTLSEVGIAFLLFLVGINLDWRSIKDVGPVALLAGLGQAFVTSAVGYILALALGFGLVESVFLGVAFAFSSTIVVVKLLADKEDLERLYGRISIGILIVQDLLAMVILLAIAALRDNTGIAQLLTVSLGKGVAVIAVLWLIAHYVLPKAFAYAARSQELLFLSAIGWCFVVASVLQVLGFGIEIGALLAGISLAGTGFNREIESKLTPLRDFFLVIFFIVLGTNLSLGSLQGVWWPAAAFSIFVLVGNPLIVLLLLRTMGYHPRAGFLTGTTVAQISEFSFIVLTGGIAAGLVSADVLPLATVVGLVTIAVSSYLIMYNDSVYNRIDGLFAWMVPKNPKRQARLASPPKAILFGYRDMGHAVYDAMRKVTDDVLVVDFDPHQIEELEEKGIRAMYGDAANDEFLASLRAHKSRLIVSTIPNRQVGEEILSYLGKRKASSTVILTAKHQQDADRLYDSGASFVIVPSVMGGAYFAQLLQKKKTAKRPWKAAAKKYTKAVGRTRTK